MNVKKLTMGALVKNLTISETHFLIVKFLTDVFHTFRLLNF